MKLSDFDYHLPPHCIAQTPADPRDSSRLMIVNGDRTFHRKFRDLPGLLRAGDLLVLNDSRVIPARLPGTKETGGKVEVLLVKRLDDDYYECLVKGKVGTGRCIHFHDGTTGTVVEKVEYPSGHRHHIKFNCNTTLEEHLQAIGIIPVPPYIKKALDNSESYQTVYSRYEGSIAAPTAGLHFTDEMLDNLEKKGVRLSFITLHVGIGTFMPVRAENVEEHIMDPEYFIIDKGTTVTINETISRKKRIFVVGTTTVRALESARWEDGMILPTDGWSDCFIYPPYVFRTPISGLITNFHLPGSTLLMLVSAFKGKDVILNAYRKAVDHGYRFYSFGDAMLLMNSYEDEKCLR